MSQELRPTTHLANRLRLEVRFAVAARRMELDGDVAFYLSLFGDEIDIRIDALTKQSEPTAIGTDDPDQVALNVEPTDALVVARRDGSVVVARGGACNFPLYWSRSGDSIAVNTSLRVEEDSVLSREGLLDSVAVVGYTYRNEPNVMLRAPIAGWHRLRRGCVSRLAPDGSLTESLIDHARSVTSIGRDALIAAIRSSLDDFGARQRRMRSKSVIELSGGIDSTVAAIGARTHGVDLCGVSVSFPFYEFRYEEGIQASVADELQVRRSVVDGTTVFSYAPPTQWPRLDEPATLIMALKRDQTMAQVANAEGVDRVYVGEGGDELFAENMLEAMSSVVSLPRALFSTHAWDTIEQTRSGLLAQPMLRQRSLLTFIYDARLDVTMKETYGTTTRSPFTDLAMARCGLQWATLTKQLGERHSKRILLEAFADEMPDAVSTRRGKVSWDGVFARAYAAHADTIQSSFERNQRVLEHLGIDVAWLTRRVRELSRWERTKYGSDDGAVFALYALATWLQSCGIQQPSDHQWTP
jgi:asparagine synthetase B (glutamine-hydrolysing)